jgi:hypothetical protein
VTAVFQNYDVGIVFGGRCIPAVSRIIVLLGPKVLYMQRNGKCAVSYVKRNKGQCRAVIIVRKISRLTVDPMTPVVQWAV